MPTRTLQPERRTTQVTHQDKGLVNYERASETRRGRGRPPGSKNKAKSVFPAEVASEVLLAMKDVVRPEDFEYMKGVIKDGKAVMTEKEVDIIILMMTRALLPAMVHEQRPFVKGNLPDDIAAEVGGNQSIEPEFRKDVTERLKLLATFLNIKQNIEKGKRDEGSDTKEKPILNIFLRSGLDAGRLGILIGALPNNLGASTSPVGGGPDMAGTVSDQFPERPLLLPYSEQVEANRNVNGSSDRDDPFRVRKEELQR